jgi:hypothetical protein
VVANETVGGDALRACLRRKSEGVQEEILVVTPALNSPVKHWVSDEDGARAAARRRLEASLERLRADGIEPFPHEFPGVEPIAGVLAALLSWALASVCVPWVVGALQQHHVWPLL